MTGKLIIKDGKKKVGKGKVARTASSRSRSRASRSGNHKLVVDYKGDGYTEKGKSKEVKVTVKA